MNITQSIKSNFFASIIFGVVYFLINYTLLFYLDLHEDAYILLTYIRNFSETGVISYYQGGPPTEGATDFLWFILGSLLTIAGIDPAVSLVLINTVGWVVLFWIYLDSFGEKSKLFIIPILFFIALTSHIFLAGIFGFSAPFFCSLFLLQIREIFNEKQQRIHNIFFWGFLLALCRPEGAFLGVFNALISIVVIPKSFWRSYLHYALIYSCLGIFYFWWRYWYFGEILPLPLLIKSSSDALVPGYLDNRHWLKDHVFLAGACISVFCASRDHMKRIIVCCLPVGFWIVILLFIDQIQNVSHRFQAPASAILLWIVFTELGRLSKRRRTEKIFVDKVCFSGVWFCILMQGLFFAKNLQGVAIKNTTVDYLSDFPQRLAVTISSSEDPTIAISEAGRFGYWFPGKKLDIVGLNNAEVASNGISQELLISADADLIFFHHAWTFAEYLCPDQKPFCGVDKKLLTANFAWADTYQYVDSNTRVKQSGARAGLFLLENIDNYSVYFARYGDLYPHVYAVKKDGLVQTDDFEMALSDSYLEAEKRSYFDNLLTYNTRLNLTSGN